MIRRELEDLAVINTNGKKLSVFFCDIQHLLYQKTSEVIYLVDNNKLYGVICMGDILKIKNDGSINVNTNFSSIAFGGGILTAKEIFRSRENIHKIPIVSKDGVLLGDYSRWDDMRFLKRDKKWDILIAKCILNLDRRESIKIAVVRPCDSFTEKILIYERLRDELIRQSVSFLDIDRENVYKCAQEGYILLFVDMDERKGSLCICQEIIKENYEISSLAFTYQGFIENYVYDRTEEERGRDVLKQLLEKGVHCYTLSCGTKEKQFLSEYKKEIEKRTESRNISKDSRRIWEVIAKDFFGELYSDAYASGIDRLTFDMQSVNGVNRLKDAAGEYYNVKNGERKTCDQPEEFERTIYFFGPCIVIGVFVEDQYTIESYLQRKLNSSGWQYKVVNYGNLGTMISNADRILECEFKEGDIVITYTEDKEWEEIPNLDLVQVAKNAGIPVEWMTNNFLHCNHKANEVYADYIYEMLKPVLKKGQLNVRKNIVLDRAVHIRQTYLDKYFSDFEPEDFKTIGAIVMNCNPFTKGHLYLIKEACKQVDFLIVFVVEEDLSLFSFEERFAMVWEGTKELQNIRIVPSGNFILSQKTFPEYFVKIKDEDIIRNIDFDINLFAECIAKPLNIKCRFVGQELSDPVTKQYNDLMKEILPLKGIELIEIPRKKQEGLCISATRVRKYLKEGEVEKAFELIPETTRQFL